ncbi:unnamed protein product [Effrenium voratum]|uniref:Uncharacterized protein n=1 Tax=Effrenium voratum TaxID=2562239 RepID=A0AA36I1Y4_9DINO|nr:unnamed protein product [Effrenium voratum]
MPSPFFEKAGWVDEESRKCCPEGPARQVLAWLQLAADHNRQQLSSLETAVSNAIALREMLDDDCRNIQEALLLARAGALKAMVEDAQSILEMVVHLVISGLCRFCFDISEENLVELRDKEAAAKLAEALAKFQRLQGEIHRGDVSVAEVDLERRCVPHYLAQLLPGEEVGDMENLSEAVERMIDWPIGRALQNPKMAKAMMLEGRFSESFIEAGERLFGAVLAAPGRVGHQLNLLCLAMERRNHWSEPHATARLLWGPAPELQLYDAEEFLTPPADPPPPPRADNESYSQPDPDAAFGLVVLISNQTRDSTVGELMQRLEGPRCLFLEDSCGSALDALGYNCHSEPHPRNCLHPSHVSGMVRVAEEAWAPKLQPHVAWRRHAGTRSIAQSALELGSSLWGAHSSIWLMDFRPEASCPGLPLAEQVRGSKRMHLVKDPDVLMAMEPHTAERKAAARQEEPPAWPEDTPLAVRLAEYTAMHQAAMGQDVEGLKAPGTKFLVYSCQPFAQCGGHGDRLNGIITVFMLAVLLGRVFLIDSESPLPMQLLLEPRALDWRVSGGLLATAGLRHFSYHDKRQLFEADLEQLASFPEQVMVINMNYRMIRSLFEAPALQAAAAKLGLPRSAPRFLSAEIFDLLFAPTQLLRQELFLLRSELSLNESFIAIHLRTGQIAWDPSRHGAGELQDGLERLRPPELSSVTSRGSSRHEEDTHISDGRSVDGSDHEDVVAKTRRRVREVKERERLERLREQEEAEVRKREQQEQHTERLRRIEQEKRQKILEKKLDQEVRATRQAEEEKRQEEQRRQQEERFKAFQKQTQARIKAEKEKAARERRDQEMQERRESGKSEEHRVEDAAEMAKRRLIERKKREQARKEEEESLQRMEAEYAQDKENDQLGEQLRQKAQEKRKLEKAARNRQALERIEHEERQAESQKELEARRQSAAQRAASRLRKEKEEQERERREREEVERLARERKQRYQNPRSIAELRTGEAQQPLTQQQRRAASQRRHQEQEKLRRYAEGMPVEENDPPERGRPPRLPSLSRERDKASRENSRNVSRNASRNASHGSSVVSLPDIDGHKVGREPSVGRKERKERAKEKDAALEVSLDIPLGLDSTPPRPTASNGAEVLDCEKPRSGGKPPKPSKEPKSSSKWKSRWLESDMELPSTSVHQTSDLLEDPVTPAEQPLEPLLEPLDEPAEEETLHSSAEDAAEAPETPAQQPLEPSLEPLDEPAAEQEEAVHASAEDAAEAPETPAQPSDEPAAEQEEAVHASAEDAAQAPETPAQPLEPLLEPLDEPAEEETLHSSAEDAAKAPETPAQQPLEPSLEPLDEPAAEQEEAVHASAEDAAEAPETPAQQPLEPCLEPVHASAEDAAEAPETPTQQPLEPSLEPLDEPAAEQEEAVHASAEDAAEAPETPAQPSDEPAFEQASAEDSAEVPITPAQPLEPLDEPSAEQEEAVHASAEGSAEAPQTPAQQPLEPSLEPLNEPAAEQEEAVHASAEDSAEAPETPAQQPLEPCLEPLAVPASAEDAAEAPETPAQQPLEPSLEPLDEPADELGKAMHASAEVPFDEPSVEQHSQEAQPHVLPAVRPARHPLLPDATCDAKKAPQAAPEAPEPASTAAATTAAAGARRPSRPTPEPRAVPGVRPLRHPLEPKKASLDKGYTPTRPPSEHREGDDVHVQLSESEEVVLNLHA